MEQTVFVMADHEMLNHGMLNNFWGVQGWKGRSTLLHKNTGAQLWF
jgi:hypothetical protein